MMSDEFLVDRSGNGRDLKRQVSSDDRSQRLIAIAGPPIAEPCEIWEPSCEPLGVVSVPGLPKHDEPGAQLEQRDGPEEYFKRDFTDEETAAVCDWAEAKGGALAAAASNIRQARELLTQTVNTIAANVPLYEPIELLCGTYSASEKPHRYLLADVRRWAAGDLEGIHSTPREVIAVLAETVRTLLMRDQTCPLPIPDKAWIVSGRLITPALSVWVNLREKGNPQATEEQIAARMEGLRPWRYAFPVFTAAQAFNSNDRDYEAADLERWARGDQRDLHADAVTTIRGLAGEVLRLAGLE